MTTQITMKELLADPVFRKWMTKKPSPVASKVRWRLYVQREEGGPWAKKDVDSYSQGYRHLATNFKRWHDASLTCLSTETLPPIVRKPAMVKIKDPQTGKIKQVKGYKRVYHSLVRTTGHRWCGYCRRPTVFRKFSKHHALPTKLVGQLSWETRCTICGIREVSIRRR